MVALLVGLAMQIILEAQKPDISLERKVEALTFAQTVIKYANEHPEIDALNQVVTITPMVKPIDERVKVLEDKQAEIDVKAQADAEKARVKAERVASAKAVYDSVQAEFLANQDAYNANQHRFIELGTGITTGEIGMINRETERLTKEQEEIVIRRTNASNEWRQAEVSE